MNPKVVDQFQSDMAAIYNGDSCEVLAGLPDESVHYSVYSPPFASLFTYSNSERDLGNCGSYEEFFEHYKFIVDHLYRLTKPGRLVSFHCMLLPTTKEHDGFMGLRDFRGDLIRAHQAAGFVFHSEVVIWKDPLIAATRTHAHGLAHKELVKDSAVSRQGIPDYLVTVRKPGVNAEPISHKPSGLSKWIGDDESKPKGEFDPNPGKNKQSHLIWQKYASPVWMDIKPGDTLQRESAREHADERHICLVSGSLVLTREHGYRAIEDIDVGDHVLTHKGRWRPVTAKRCNGLADTIRVCAQGVADLTLTPTHNIWTRKARSWDAKRGAMESEPGWMEAQSTIGSYVNLKLPPVEDSPLTTEEWWIVGRWLGDGHRGGREHSGTRGGVGQFLISCAHEESEGLKRRLGVNAGHAATRTATQIALVGLRKEVRSVLDRCGLGATSKTLPAEAFTLCSDKAEALLSGYLSADGHYVAKHDRQMASSVSRGLLLGMAMLAQRARNAVASVYGGRPARRGFIQGREVSMSQDWIFAFRNSDGHHKSGWIAKDGAWKKVRKISVAGVRVVWDLQVEEDESFTAEGCIVHNCPLQLQVIERGIELWSNPGDVVLSPFAGIGSELYVAVKMGRRAIGVELKESYYRMACLNVRAAEKEATQIRLDFSSESAE